MSDAQIIDCIEEQLTTIAALAGLFDENFNRGAGWRFYELGRRIERGINTCRIARQFAHQKATEHDLDVLLDLIDSQITYHSRTLIGVALAPVRDLTLLDPYNPRSVAFQTERIAEHIAALPVLRQDGIPEEPLRLATRLSAELASEIADQLEDAGILAIENQIAATRRGDRAGAISCTAPRRAPKRSWAWDDLRRHPSHALRIWRAGRRQRLRAEAEAARRARPARQRLPRRGAPDAARLQRA